MKKEALENINGGLFKPFNPEEELWVVGGSTSAIRTLTCALTTYDWDVNGDWDPPDE